MWTAPKIDVVFTESFLLPAKNGGRWWRLPRRGDRGVRFALIRVVSASLVEAIGDSTHQWPPGMPEHYIIWEPLPGIAFPCAGISFGYHHKTDLRVLMHFSNVVNGPGQDLLLTFRGVIGFRWNPEDLGSVFYPARSPLPTVTDSRWKDWTFPLLEVCDSSWLATYKGYPSADGRKHYNLVAMNDLVDILALPDVVATWQSADQARVHTGVPMRE